MVAETLDAIERERMGLGENPLGGVRTDLETLGAAILAWFNASQARWVEFGPLRR